MRVCVRLMRARALVHLGVGLGLDAWCGVGCGQVCGRAVLGFFFSRFFFLKKVFSFACLGAGAWARVCVCGLSAAFFFLKRKCFSFFFLLKFIHVVNHDTSMHDVHTSTAAFRQTVHDVHTNTVLIKCSICSYRH